MLRIHYYRYDQDYTGWDLWIWEKGKDGSLFMFNKQELLNGDTGKVAKIAEIDVSGFNSNEIGLIVRRGGWHERDLHIDRYYAFTNNARNSYEDIYLVQDTAEIFTSLDELHLSPGFEKAIFQNFREIFVALQAPAHFSHEQEPFQVFENGLNLAVRHVTPIRGNREFIISLENDMMPGSTYMIYKPGFRNGYVDYGMIYDTPEFDNLFTYNKDDLGANWSPDSTCFKVWAPTASAMFLNLYETGSGPNLKDVVEMKREDKGVWEISISGDLSGTYYTFSSMVMGKTLEAADPYARSSGVNGRRSMVVNPAMTIPEGWESVRHKELLNPTDAVVYEVHVRDITIHPSSQVQYPGKFLGLAQNDTRSYENMPTGLSHLVDLGVTHVHLLPVFDFFTVDETKPSENQYNWGYDPTNFNVPDGSYATDAHNGYIRIIELKKMIMSLKKANIGVVMDVVYNHTYKTIDSDFNKLVPGYYYRQDRMGNFSNGSGCGNEIATERSMVRNFILTSVKMWAQEYKIDGFRFDLMGLIDIKTMNDIRLALDRISPSILLYGEGWTGGHSLLKGYDASSKANAAKLNKIGFFNDNTRDAIKGDAFHQDGTGFINGNYKYKEGVKFGVVGAVYHPGIDYSKVNYSGYAWAAYPWHCVNYTASHDNLTLYDKLLASRPDLKESDYIRLVNLAAAIVLTSQGIPFFMLGTDMMRTKKGEHNSYNLPDGINQIDWSLKHRYQQVFNYHKGLISLRKAHPAFRMIQAEEIRKNLTFYPCPEHAIAFSLNNYANNDSWKTIFVAYNAGMQKQSFSLPMHGHWNVVVDEKTAGVNTLYDFIGDVIDVPAISAMVLYLSN
ncbi:MAG: type I pullulanase [Clostridiaceae bacterium]|jgi:pullulanase|nr:type I pullulanase [Clostridiaceae bacterium]